MIATTAKVEATELNYHAHPAISRTGLKCFRESRRLYHARHVLRLPEAQMEPTPAMNLGTLAHAELLEPGSLEGKYAVLEDWPDFRTNAAKAWRDEQQAAGKMVIKPGEIDAMVAMVKNAGAAVGKWLSDNQAVIEQPIFWQDDSGMSCRCKPDWIIRRDDFIVACDFKTTADASPSAFARQVANLELWLQDEHYTRGIKKAYNAKSVVFLFVAVESNYPHRAGLHQVERTVFSDNQISSEYRDTIAALKRCQDTNDWAEPWEGKVNKIALRDWAFESDAMGK